jgi:hypothetical protein
MPFPCLSTRQSRQVPGRVLMPILFTSPIPPSSTPMHAPTGWAAAQRYICSQTLRGLTPLEPSFRVGDPSGFACAGTDNNGDREPFGRGELDPPASVPRFLIYTFPTSAPHRALSSILNLAFHSLAPLTNGVRGIVGKARLVSSGRILESQCICLNTRRSIETLRRSAGA